MQNPCFRSHISNPYVCFVLLVSSVVILPAEMSFSLVLGSLLCLFGVAFGAAINITPPSLGPLLSPHASIDYTAAGVIRWSEFDAPTPGIVVNVATEHDVLVTVSSPDRVLDTLTVVKVQYCNLNNIPFLVQNGGHGWATTFNLKQNGLLINLRGIRSVTFNAQRTEVTVQGGALISDVIDAAYAQNTLVTTGNCNCVGTLGAILGGGYGNLMGLNGFGVDNIISLNIVTAAGIAITVNPNLFDLWWALRGAGPNFAVVTSAVMKAYPVTPDQTLAWLGTLTFTEDKLETLVQTINDLVLQSEMNIFLYYLNTGTPNPTPTIAVTVFYYGNETEGRAVFAPIFAVGPVSDNTSVMAYNHWNDGANPFCSKGARKPSYGAGLTKLVPATWRAVWNVYVSFVQENSNAARSYVVMEAYSLTKARSLPDSSSSFPWRSTVNFNAVATAWYTDPSLDQEAEAFGSTARNLWRSTDGLASNST